MIHNAILSIPMALDSTRDYILNLQRIAPSHEQQALLPKETVRHCQCYEKQWQSVKRHYEILKGLDSKKTLYGGIRSKYADTLVCRVQLFFESARELKADLIKYGGITETDLIDAGEKTCNESK